MCVGDGWQARARRDAAALDKAEAVKPVQRAALRQGRTWPEASIALTRNGELPSTARTEPTADAIKTSV